MATQTNFNAPDIVVTTDDIERLAHVKMPPKVATFYRDGADQQQTIAENLLAFKRFRLLPRVMRDVSTIDTECTLLGQRLSIPVGISPTALQKMARPDGESATARAEDACEAVNHGASAILVSNHGGRQLDGVPATIEVLATVVRAVRGRCEVYMDGGVHRGTDVIKALALGARAVFVGRPVIWGLAYNGEEGVKKVLNIFKTELERALALMGCASLSDIKAGMVIHHDSLKNLLSTEWASLQECPSS